MEGNICAEMDKGGVFTLHLFGGKAGDRVVFEFCERLVWFCGYRPLVPVATNRNHSPR